MKIIKGADIGVVQGCYGRRFVLDQAAPFLQSLNGHIPAKDDSWLIPQMMVTDAETALTFLEMAENRRDAAELLEQMIKNARLTYTYIVERRPSVPMSADYAMVQESKLAALKGALEQLGESVE